MKESNGGISAGILTGFFLGSWGHSNIKSSGRRIEYIQSQNCNKYYKQNGNLHSFPEVTVGN